MKSIHCVANFQSYMTNEEKLQMNLISKGFYLDVVPKAFETNGINCDAGKFFEDSSILSDDQKL